MIESDQCSLLLSCLEPMHRTDTVAYLAVYLDLSYNQTAWNQWESVGPGTMAHSGCYIQEPSDHSEAQ